MSKSAKVRAIPKLTESLKLTKPEASVLLPIIRGGNMTEGAIALSIDETLGNVRKALGSLEKRGLIEKIEGVIPIFRALPPILPITEALALFAEESEKIRDQTVAASLKQQKATDAALSMIMKTNEARTEKLSNAFDTYETELVESVKTQIEKMVTLTTEVLNDYSQKMQIAQETINQGLENELGEKLTLLQEELDKSQTQLNTASKKIMKDFNKWVKAEKTSSFQTIKDLEVKTKNLTKAAKATIKKSHQSAEEVLNSTTEQLAAALNVRTLETTNSVSGQITDLSMSLKQKTAALDSNISQVLAASQNALEETSAHARANADLHTDATRKKLDEAVSTTKSFTDIIIEWNSDVNNYLDTSGQSVIAQLEQLSGSENAFLEVVRTALTGFIDKTNSSVNDEYKSLRAISRGLSSDTESFMNAARTSVIELLQNEIEGGQERLQKVSEQLLSELEKWNDKSTKGIDKKVSSAVREVSVVLDTEAAELVSLTDNMASRLRSSFSGVRTTTETKNESIIANIKKSASEYEASIEAKLAELASRYIEVIQLEVIEAKTLYDDLNTRLNERLIQSMGTMNSQVNTAQKEINNSVVEQVSRIDRQAEEMREEFHIRVEDMTRQFITLTQSLESTFNGLLSSQTVEARDLISSAHTEFGNAIKSEMALLDSDSIKLQQEFASEIGMHVDSVVESTSALQRTLDSFTLEKRNELSKNMQDTIVGIETTLLAAQQSLAEIETGTVGQFVESIQQVSKEFGTSVSGARDNIAERLTSIRDDTAGILAKNTSSVKGSVDVYLSEEKESLQRVIGAVSTKLDGLSSSNNKKAGKKMEEFQTLLETHQSDTVEGRVKSRKSIMKTVEDRKSEAVLAFDAAQVWVESSMDNIKTSMETFGSKLNNEIIHVQNNLEKISESTVLNIEERSEQQITQLEEISRTFLAHNEAQLKTGLNDFNSDGEILLNATIDALSEFPEKMMNETNVAFEKAIASNKEKLGTLDSDVSEKAAEFETTVQVSCDEMISLIERTSEQAANSLESSIEETKQSALVSNQHAARKFESIGVDLKASISGSSYEIIEGLLAEAKEKTAGISDSSAAVNSDIDTLTNTLHTTRVDAITKASETRQESLNTWAGDTKELSQNVSSIHHTSISGLVESSRSIVELLNSIHSASEEIVLFPTENTWYLSGKDEICGHILDMAQRAEESMVISLVSTDCVDFKKLSKVKTPPRRVIVVPETDEPDAEIESLKGWRIWETRSPMLLAVMDDKEILIGGQLDEDKPLCVLSRDRSFLKLYHDSLGPKLVQDSTK
ncbi:MAG: hypothetical protein P1Q69_05740 [Candidatus Thorarchaeota archaeon]|nr:hypothetical protein [Candidatus Thorarchaeota archaeon]